MGGKGSSKTNNASRARKRVQVDSASDSSATATATAPSSLKRAHDGSAFTRCDQCNKNVPVVLIDFHDCFVEAKIQRTLDAQMAECDATVVDKKKTKSAEPKAKKVKKEKKAKDPNAPKRPPTAFFLFMFRNEFRISYKEANPDCKSVATVAKEGGEKWKSMTDEEKATYVERAKELKADYEKALKSVNVAQSANDEGESIEKEVEVETIPDDDD